MSGTTTGGYAEAVGGWSAHLREGGTTTWSAWRSTAPRHVPDGRAEVVVPSATHLELVRRLNLEAGTSAPGLSDLVLATPSPGRGRVDVPLTWAGDDLPRFGSPAMEPEQLPEDELVRLAVGVLARLLPGVPAPAPTPDLTRWPTPWRRRFRLHGSPGTVAAVRRALLAQGLVETDWRPTHVVLGRPVAVMMAEHWAAAATRGGVYRWGTLWNRAQTRGALPARLDVGATARRLASSADRRREPVHLVLGRDDAEVARHVAAALGTRQRELRTATDPARLDLLRRLNRHAQIVVGSGRTRRLAEKLADVLDHDRPSVEDQTPEPPQPALEWARQTAQSAAARVRDEHEEAGYAVHGDPGALVPTGVAQGGVDPRRTLEEALWACREAWRRQEGTT
jgi:hypothetical protein